ncbi:MAG: hypothetical protein HQL95_04590 [Magnetococcales bacterium]|nr:hypothetical protein [Magnetococcales bacterium]
MNRKSTFLAVSAAALALTPIATMAMDPATAATIATTIAPFIPENVGSVLGDIFGISGFAAHIAAAFAPPGSTGKVWQAVHLLGGNYGKATNASASASVPNPDAQMS